MIEWCNSNSGFIMTILTLIYVVASVIVAALMVRANRLTAQSTEMAVKLDKERSKPSVVFEFLPEIPYFCLRIRNIGLTTAYNLKFHVSPEPRLCFGGKNQMPAEKIERTIQFVSEGIRSLPPQGEVRTTLGTLARIEEGLGSLHFRGLLTYNDAFGGSHETMVDVDGSIYRGLVYSGKKAIDCVANELEKIARELGHICSGFHKPTVITQDIKEHRKEEMEFIESAQEEMSKMQSAEQHVGQVSSEAASSVSADKPSS